MRAMYALLLRAALAERTDEDASTENLVDEVLVRRGRLGPFDPEAEGGGLAEAVADELAYDTALIDLCRHVGVEWELSAFNQPARAREHLERLLVTRNVAPFNLTSAGT